jgi:hypothetical protein
MKLSEKETEAFKQWLKGMLATNTVTVQFTKKDGTDRTMLCTTNSKLVPTFEIKETTELKKERKVNDATMCVFDLESKAWKSFRWDSVKKVEVAL